jgi:hypothetical protein
MNEVEKMALKEWFEHLPPCVREMAWDDQENLLLDFVQTQEGIDPCEESFGRVLRAVHAFITAINDHA